MNKFAIKQQLKKNKNIDTIFRLICKPYFYYKYTQSENELEKRKNGFLDTKYQWMLDLKNSAKSKRCFVIATGPSLIMDDLELIKNEFSFGMNSVIKAFDKTEWRPNLYMIQDEYVYEKLENEIFDVTKKNNFLVCVGGVIPIKFKTAENYLSYALHYLDHKMYHNKSYGQYKFSDDCYNVIYDGYTVTFSVLQMACYMGFNEIYLLGCDCNYNQSKSHFVDYGHHDPKATIMGDKMITGHFEFKKFADSLGIRVINCTRGGMLEVYPRMNLKDVVKEEK